MIRVSALFNLTPSRTLRLLLDALAFSGLATIMLFIELSYFMRNVLAVVWATTKTVKGP